MQKDAQLPKNANEEEIKKTTNYYKELKSHFQHSENITFTKESSFEKTTVFSTFSSTIYVRVKNKWMYAINMFGSVEENGEVEAYVYNIDKSNILYGNHPTYLSLTLGPKPRTLVLVDIIKFFEKIIFQSHFTNNPNTYL